MDSFSWEVEERMSEWDMVIEELVVGLRPMSIMRVWHVGSRRDFV